MNKYAINALTVAALTTLAAPAWADAGESYAHHWGGGHMIFGSLMMLVFFVLLVSIVVFIVRRIGGSNQDSLKPRNAALAILQERYARGEIDKDEFEEKKTVLS